MNPTVYELAARARQRLLDEIALVEAEIERVIKGDGDGWHYISRWPFRVRDNEDDTGTEAG
jgi:hypothetical protein